MLLSPPFKNRMTLRYLQHKNKISSRQYQTMMDTNLQSSGPFKIINLYILILGFILIGAGAICLTAFNWLALSSLHKLMLAEAGLIATFISGLLLPRPIHKEIAFGLFAIMIGCFWAVFGQIYQINSSLYHYPLVWLISLLPFSIILKQKFTTLLTAVLLYTSALLYTEAQLGFGYDTKLAISLLLLLIATVINFAFILLSKKPKSSFSTVGSYLFFCLVAITFVYCGFTLHGKLSYLIFLIIITFLSVAYIVFYLKTQQKTMIIIIYLIGCAFIFTSLIFKLDSYHIGTFSYTLICSLYAIIIAYPIYKSAMALLKLATKEIGAQP